MSPESDIVFSQAEADAFARRIGLSWLRPADTQRLREAMATIAEAGLAVLRQSSKFDQPAFTFNVASLARSPA
jgi:hypothetical protein